MDIKIPFFDSKRDGAASKSAKELLKGKYNFQFDLTNVPASTQTVVINVLQELITQGLSITGKKVVPYKTYIDYKDKKTIVNLYLDIQENPIPLAIIIGGIAGLLGIFGGYLLLDKVQRILEIDLVPLLAGGAVIIFLLKKK